MSAAYGLFAGGMADNWGINSEGWLWWEASLERLGDPQVEGEFTIEGATKSDYPTRSRLTFPESLFGTEMLVTAASGATVFSIEAPWRGTVDVGNETISPTGESVVFPVLRRLIADRAIPDREEALGRTPIAFWPTECDQPELAYDRAFSGLYGPEGCTEEDNLACAQRQWLPSTGRYGLIPTLPVLVEDGLPLITDDGSIIAKSGTSAQPQPTTGRLLMPTQGEAGYMELPDGQVVAFALYMNNGIFGSIGEGLDVSKADMETVLESLRDELAE